jgi:hypothetical protein
MAEVVLNPEQIAAKAKFARLSPVAEFSTITVDLAREMLLTNIHNRPTKPVGIKRLVHEMENDDWHITNQGIGFSKDGCLIDGQNRLLSILQSGKAIVTLVVYGLEPRAQQKVDRHSRRSLADSLLLAGSDHQLCARMCEAARATLLARNQVPTLPDSLVAKYIDEHFAGLEWTSEMFRRRVRGISRAPVLGACSEYYEHCPDKTKPEAFVRGLLDATSAEERSSVYMLREWLLTSASALHSDSAVVLLYRATKMAAVNHWLGNPIEKIDPTDRPEWPQ